MPEAYIIDAVRTPVGDRTPTIGTARAGVGASVPLAPPWAGAGTGT